MMDNHMYNLMEQLLEEHKSLWRMKETYKQDAGDCSECKDLWNDLEKQKEENVEKIMEIIKDHMNS